MNKRLKPGLTYKDAGVDIHAGSALVERIKPIAAKTRTAGVLSGLGGFGSLFELPLDRFKNPVLVSGTDGVGTKLKLALELGKHDTVGIDLVAMCVNDILVQGAEPLFFLDYFATGHLDVEVAATVVEGIGKGCELAGAALIGGETAEMPGMYSEGDYDLAGFCVGIAEKDRIIDGSHISPGDCLIGLASSGPHSNGYSLIRKIVEHSDSTFDQKLEEQSIGDLLLEPTRIYVKNVLQLMQTIDIHGLAHITGGGISENLPRILPPHTKANINLSAWDQPAIFHWLQQHGNVSESEMLKTFNCGVGMIVCIAAKDETETLTMLESLGETAFVIGNVDADTTDRLIEYHR